MTSVTRRQLLFGETALIFATAAAGCSTPGTTGGDSAGDSEVTFLTFETPNLTWAYWDAAIKRVTDKHPDVKVKKLVAPTADGRTDYAKQLPQSGQFPDVMVGVSPAGFAEAGLYAWSEGELQDFSFPSADGRTVVPAYTGGLATLPVLVFCLALQKHFVKGLTGGATKG